MLLKPTTCELFTHIYQLKYIPPTGNGYYLSKVFDTNSGLEIYDNEVTRSGQPHYYKYNLEYSVISR